MNTYRVLSLVGMWFAAVYALEISSLPRSACRAEEMVETQDRLATGGERLASR